MNWFYYKGERFLGEQKIESIEGFPLENVVDFALGNFNDGKEQLVVKLTNIEDKDTFRNFPILSKGAVKASETRFVRRNENALHLINDPEAIQNWKEMIGYKETVLN